MHTMFLLRMVLFLLAVTLLPAWGVHRLVLSKKRKRWKAALWVLALIQVVGAVAFVSWGFKNGNPLWLWQGFFSFFLGMCGAEVSLILTFVLARLFKRIAIVSKAFKALGFLVALLITIIVVMAFIIGNKRIEVKQYSYSHKAVPVAFDGFRIAHISDLHLGTYGTDTSRVSQLIDKVMDQHPDMILFTGDLVNFESKEALPFVDQLKRLKAPYGVYSVMGNHDYAVYRNQFSRRQQVEDIKRLVEIEEDCGWHMLRNAHAVVHKDGDSITIVGVDNDGRPPFPQLADLPKALKGVPTGDAAFKILLTHDPSHWRHKVLPTSDIQLTLSGHTHGMQFKIFSLSPARLLYKEWGGQYYEGDRSIIVTLGLGLGAVPFRFGAWSEVCVITLGCGAK